MPSLNGSTSHSGRDGRPPTSSKDRLCSAVTTSGPQFEIGSPRMATDIAAYRSTFGSCPGRAGSGQLRYGLLSSAVAPPCDVDLPQSNLPLGTSFASAGLFTPVLAMRAAGCSLRLAENCGRRTLRTRGSVFRRKEPAYSCARPHTGIAYTHESRSAEPDRAPLGFRFRLLRPPRERRDRCRLVPDA